MLRILKIGTVSLSLLALLVSIRASQAQNPPQSPPAGSILNIQSRRLETNINIEIYGVYDYNPQLRYMGSVGPKQPLTVPGQATIVATISYAQSGGQGVFGFGGSLPVPSGGMGGFFGGGAGIGGGDGLMFLPPLKGPQKANLAANPFAKLANEIQRLGIPGLKLDLSQIDRTKDLEVFKSLPKLKFLALGGQNDLVNVSEVMAKLALNPNIERLHLSWRREITDVDWKEISRFKNLSELCIPGDATIDERALEQIRLLPNLRSIQFDPYMGKVQNQTISVHTPDKASIRRLTKLKQLESLAVAGDAFNPETVRELSALPNLKSLYVVGVSPSPELIAELAKLPKLERFELSNYRQLTWVQPEQPRPDPRGRFEHGNRRYTELFLKANVVCGKITNADVERIASLNNLKALALVGEPFDNDSLAHLAKLDQLKSLRLGGPQFTEAAIPHLVKLKNLTELDIGDTPIISIQDLAALKNLPQLKLLTVPSVIPSSTLPQLKQMLPKVVVQRKQ